MPHLVPAMVSLSVLAIFIVFGSLYATWLENKYVHALTPLLLPQSYTGTVIQEAALRQSDLLPVFGSSEVLNEPSAYRSVNFFSTYPTGFEVFDVAKGGETSLNIAENLGALGSELKNKKIVISFTPTMFIAAEVPAQTYAGNFSLMHANEFVFNQKLSMPLRQQIAKRMLDYPKTLKADPVLRFAVRNLAQGTVWNRFLYSLVVPLGKLDIFIIRLQDHYAVWFYLIHHSKISPSVARSPQMINWNELLAEAKSQQEAATSDDPYGIENKSWIQSYHDTLRINHPGSDDRRYLDEIKASKEWGDFEIELEVLKELGAHPLIMNRPINGTLYMAEGISPTAQNMYYNWLEKLVDSFHIPLIDFKNYTQDIYFNTDQYSHTSREGWIFVDQALNTFFHE